MHPKLEKASRFEVTKDPSFAQDDQKAPRTIIRGEVIYQEAAPKLLCSESDRVDTTKKKRSADFFLTPAHQQTLHFVHDGTHYWASRQKSETRTGGTSEYITLNYLSLSASIPLRNLLEHAREQYQEYISQRVSYHRLDPHGYWDAPSYKSKRSADTVHLPQDKKQLVLEDCKSFFARETQQKYLDRNIPWRRGYLFYGPPGTGKSTLCHVLASELNLPIYEINFNNKHLDDSVFAKFMSKIPPRSIVLVEDIDAAFVKRDPSKEENQLNPYTSLSALLNAIDGVGASEGRLLCITTNYRDRLDPALIRSGRIDLEIEFTNATKEQAKEIFLRFFSPEGQNSTTMEIQAEAFAESIAKRECTISTLQNYLLLKMDDPKGAVEGIETWLCQHDKQPTLQASNDSTLE